MTGTTRDARGSLSDANVNARANADAKAGQVVRAPGKAMLFGEYAVLEGAPALVAAVDRYVTVSWVDARDGVPDSPFVQEALAARRAWLAAHGGPHEFASPPAAGSIGLSVDSSSLLSADGRKLGLGSSAAVTVAVFGPAPEMSRSEVFACCHEAHALAQKSRGSGSDIAAAVWGGILRFLPAPVSVGSGSGQPDVAPIAISPDIAITFVDTGEASSTGDRLARLALLRRSNLAAYTAMLRPLAELAAAVAGEAETRGEIPFEAVREWNRALLFLEAAIGLSILTERHRKVAACAEGVGGAGKPSGAGGGDLAVCFTTRDAVGRLRDELSSHGLSPIEARAGARGVHFAGLSDEKAGSPVASAQAGVVPR